MLGWRATAGLVRATIVGAAGLGLGVLLGDPVVVVLVAPFLVWSTFAMLHRPTSVPVVASVLDHGTLTEGQGTTSRLRLRGADGVEHVTRVVGVASHIALHPANGVVGGLSDGTGTWTGPVVEVSPRRWGRRRVGDEKVGLSSPWAGFRWGPQHLGGSQVWALPATAPFDLRAEAPQPVGLVGANRSRRLGGGSEFAGIRGFQVGDRLRRINWRVSLRTGDLHVVTARAEEDSGVLIVVDGFADHGRSGGLGGAASSLDVTVRAAAALAEHFTRAGDRVSLRVVGATNESVGYGAGKRHLRRLQTMLARLQPGEPRDFAPERLQLRTTAGTVVLVLSPMLHEAVVTATATLVRLGLPVMVIDTLPTDLVPAGAEGGDARTAALAWRMRLTDRESILGRLSRTGCPVVAWRGPGTLDEVLRRLARRAQAPRTVAR